jgi:DNA polymerase-4
MRAVTRSVTLNAPISATTMLAGIAEDLVRAALSDHPGERTITLLAVTVSHLDRLSELQLELSLGLPDEKRRPGSRQGVARWSADRAMDAIRARFGREAIGYAGDALDRRRSVPDAFRELAEKELGDREA